MREKARGVIVVDYEFATLKDMAAAEEHIRKVVEEVTKGGASIVHSDFAMQERRGDTTPDLKKMKLRK
jgi:hypothetical protein